MPNQKIALTLFLTLSSIYLQAAEPEAAIKAKQPAHGPSQSAKLSLIAEFEQGADRKIGLSDQF